MKEKSPVFTAVYEKRGKWFIATVEEISGVNTQGHTLNEARKNLQEALELILETNRILSLSSVESSQVIREPLSISVS